MDLMLKQFNEQGYVFLKGLFTKDEITKLLEDIREASNKKGRGDSLDKGNLKFHSDLFHYSQKLREFISQPKIVNLLCKIAGPDIWVRWDQAVEKAPRSVTFPWHQDNAYNGVKDQHFQFWISVTNMTKDNGGLWVKPGSHKRVYPHRRIDNHMVYEGDIEDPVFIPAEIGDVLLFSSFLLHSTTPNITEESRWAYVVEYMRADKIDPFVTAPYLMIANDGKSHLEFVDSLPGHSSIINRLKYMDLKNKIRIMLGRC